MLSRGVLLHCTGEAMGELLLRRNRISEEGWKVKSFSLYVANLGI